MAYYIEYFENFYCLDKCQVSPGLALVPIHLAPCVYIVCAE